VGQKLAPVYEALRLVGSRLEAGKTSWVSPGTMDAATYMAEGQGSSDQRAAKLWGYRDPAGFSNLLSQIATCVAYHLVRQIEAGATVVQIFDSWAGGLSEHAFLEWVIGPTKLVVERVRKTTSAAKIIGFPRGATVEGYERYVAETGVDGVSVDTALPIGAAVERLAGNAALQGNLDPILLLAGGAMMTGKLIDCSPQRRRFPSSQISAMGFCRKRRLSMLRSSSHACGARIETGRRAVQPWRARFALCC